MCLTETENVFSRKRKQCSCTVQLNRLNQVKNEAWPRRDLNYSPANCSSVNPRAAISSWSSSSALDCKKIKWRMHSSYFRLMYTHVLWVSEMFWENKTNSMPVWPDLAENKELQDANDTGNVLNCTCTYTCISNFRVPYYGITCSILIHFNSSTVTTADSLLNHCLFQFLEPTSAKCLGFLLKETKGGPGFLLSVFPLIESLLLLFVFLLFVDDVVLSYCWRWHCYL